MGLDPESNSQSLQAISLNFFDDASVDRLGRDYIGITAGAVALFLFCEAATVQRSCLPGIDLEYRVVVGGRVPNVVGIF